MNIILLYLQTKPQHGFLATLVTFLSGFFAGWGQITMDNVTFIFKNISFVLSIVVGVVTLYSQYHKLRNRKKTYKNRY